MGRTIRISGGLYACLIVIHMQVADVLWLPSHLIRAAGQDAWLVLLINGTVVLGVGALIAWIALQFGPQGAIRAARVAFGKWIGGLISLLYAAFAIWYVVISARELLDFAGMIVLPGTPGIVIASLMIGAALYAVWSGLEPIVRVAFPVMVGLLALFLPLPVMLMPEYRIFQVDPFLYSGLEGIIRGSQVASIVPGEVLLLFTLIPYLNCPSAVYRWTTIGLAGAYALLVGQVALITFVLGSVLPSRLIFPLYNLFQFVSLAQVIERLELIIIIIGTSETILKIAFCLYAAAEAIADGLGLKSHRIPAVVLSPIVLGLVHIWPGVLPFMEMTQSPLYVGTVLSWQGSILLIFLAAALLLRARPQVSAHA